MHFLFQDMEPTCIKQKTSDQIAFSFIYESEAVSWQTNWENFNIPLNQIDPTSWNENEIKFVAF